MRAKSHGKIVYSKKKRTAKFKKAGKHTRYSKKKRRKQTNTLARSVGYP